MEGGTRRKGLGGRGAGRGEEERAGPGGGGVGAGGRQPVERRRLSRFTSDRDPAASRRTETLI